MKNKQNIYKKPGWETVRMIYFETPNFKRSTVVPTIFTFFVFILSLFSDKNTFFFIDLVCESILSIVPSILGFVLTGYALLVGLNDSIAITRLMRYQKDENYTMYQQLNATFAMVLFFLFASIIVALITSLICKAELPSIVDSDNLIKIFNSVVYFLLLFLTFYTINSIKDIVVNIFDLGQFSQIIHNKTK